MSPKEDLLKLRQENSTRRPSHATSLHLSVGDVALLEQIQEILGVKRSEAIRTAIRVYAALLSQQ